MELVIHFINTVADELDHLNGSEFEVLCHPFQEMLTGKEFELKGHSLEMKFYYSDYAFYPKSLKDFLLSYAA